MKLLGVSQPTAWFMLHRIREGWKSAHGGGQFSGPVEVDETYFGGKRRNMSNAKRAALSGRGPVGKTAVVGAKDRASNQVAAKVIAATDKHTLQGFVEDHAADGATVYTDEAAAYDSLPFATRPSGTRSRSTCAGRPTRMASRASGPSSSAPTRASSTRSAPSTSEASSLGSITSAIWTLWPRWPLVAGLAGKLMRRDLVA